MDSDGCAGRLPSDLWDKIIPYLLINRAFYSNPVLLDVLQEMPETWPAFHRHKHKWLYGGFTPEYLKSYQTGPASPYPLGVFLKDIPSGAESLIPDPSHYILGPRAEIYRIISCAAPQCAVHIAISFDGYILIRENATTMNPINEGSMLAALRIRHDKIRVLPYGIQILVGSSENLWERSVLFPDEDAETGFLKMRIVPIETVMTQNNAEHFVKTNCYYMISLLDLFPDRDLKTYIIDSDEAMTRYRTFAHWIPFMNLLGYAKGTPIYDYLMALVL
jgi:hypothetical protein